MHKSVSKNNVANGVVKVCCFISLLVQVLCGLISLFNNYTANFMLFLNVYALFAIIIIFILFKGINKHFLLFGFFVCFFIFILGQKFFVVLQGGRYDRFLTFSALTLSGKEYFTFVNLLYFSLLSCFVGYFLKSPISQKSGNRQPSKKINLRKMRKLLRALYVITFICALVMQLTILSAKKDLSYTDGYLVNVDVNPIIKIGNYLFMGIAFLYLASEPPKKEMWCILISFILVQGAIQLFIGRRALIAQVLLFIVWYCICYFRLDRKKFTAKHFLLLLVFALVMIVLFYIVEVLRGGRSIDGISLFEAIERFFVSTGGSDSTIANIIRYKDAFPKSGIVYLLSPLSDALFDNILVRKIIALVSGYDVGSVAQGYEYLARHDSFSHWLSYTVNPELYLNGYGMGSSYISELYFAFGIIGIIIFGFVLGRCINRCNNLRLIKNNIYVKSLVMFFVYNLFTLPRGGVFASATNLLYLITAMIAVKLLYALTCPAKDYSYGGRYERVS